MSIRGRPPGRDERQERIWSENEERIVYALMDKPSNSARLRYLEEKTGLTRKVLNKHLDELKCKGVIIREKDGVFRLNAIYREERRIDTPLEQDREFSIQGITGIAVVRAQANKAFCCKVWSGGNLLNDKHSISIASTIPFDNQELTIKFSSTEEQTILSYYQIMIFPRPYSQE